MLKMILIITLVSSILGSTIASIETLIECVLFQK